MSSRRLGHEFSIIALSKARAAPGVPMRMPALRAIRNQVNILRLLNASSLHWSSKPKNRQPRAVEAVPSKVVAPISKVFAGCHQTLEFLTAIASYAAGDLFVNSPRAAAISYVLLRLDSVKIIYLRWPIAGSRH